MSKQLVMLSLLVADYDEAISWYQRVLNFELLEDTVLSPTKRWVVMAPPGGAGARLLLAKAATEQQQACIGNQTGGRVFLFLHTQQFWADYEHLQAAQVQIVRPPSEEPYGTVLVFADLYGNLWDLIQPR
ncbi:MAG: VOC family protein [Chitinophagaceae bacterium]|jgi:uncharacterized glyoxalase superfamily protein PhnB|nr:VOC family protein [Chitinophagaceae bacterium]